MNIKLSNKQIESVIDSGYNPLDVFSNSMIRSKRLTMIRKTLKLAGLNPDELLISINSVKSLDDNELATVSRDFAEQFF